MTPLIAAGSSQERVTEGNVHVFTLFGWTTVEGRFAATARAGLHKNNAVGSSYALAVIRCATVDRQAVMKNRAAGPNRRDALLSFGN